MAAQWKTTRLDSVEELFATLGALQSKGWLFRGQSKDRGALFASIDRSPRDKLTRPEKLALERRSIETYRSAARDFASQGEEQAMVDDFVALMVLRHYGVPTRLLDWTGSPLVAAFFSASNSPDSDAEIWTFNEPLYESEGAKQWMKYPETTTCGTGAPEHFAAGLTAFKADLAFDWFICAFYPAGFPRQHAQSGAYSMTAQFSQDHRDHIAQILKAPEHFHRYVFPAGLKPLVLEALRERHGVWHGALFPDSAGAAETAKRLFDC